MVRFQGEKNELEWVCEQYHRTDSLQQEAKHMNFNRPWYDIHAYRLPTMITELQIETHNLGQIQKECSRVIMF